jgi:TPP-dependent pyruvate/acetoin dehydrogenase alpha subunit
MKKSPLGRDPLTVAEDRLMKEDWLTTRQLNDMRAECRAEVDEAMSQASKEPAPDPFKESWMAISTHELAEGIWEA